jgi:hypothetical protein
VTVGSHAGTGCVSTWTRAGYTVPGALDLRACRAAAVHVHVHVHVKLPSRQDARPQVPWRHNVEGARCGAHTHAQPKRATPNHTNTNSTKNEGGRECQGGDGADP